MGSGNRGAIVAGVAGLAVAAAGASAQLVTNGGFESGSFSGWTQFGNTAFSGVGGAGLPGGGNPHGGSFASYFGPTGTTGGIQQTIAAHAGDHLVIDFFYECEGGGTADSFSADFDGHNLVSFTNDTAHPTWTEFNFPVVVTADNPVLSFTFRNDPSYDQLDDVSVAPFNGSTGACCLGTTGCTITSQAACAVQNGTYAGDNTTCASVNCPTGGCCFPNFTCTVTGPGGCTAQGGTYAGDNTTCATANCPGPSAGPDVIVGEVYDMSYDGAVGAISAYSVGTDSCNLGDIGVVWDQGTNQHPVISGNMFRLKTVNGASHFEQIGLSWFKNGFFATNQSFCGACSTPGGAMLGPGGCSDVYTAGLNGSQSNMGPRSVVNGTTGDFPYPYTLGWQTTGNAIYKHCQCFTSDIDPAQNGGALYFADAHYVVPDDARFSHNGANATNGLNNYSYRQILISSTTAVPTFNGLTHEQMPGIQAWRDQDAGVTLVNADYVDSTGVPGTNIVARFKVAAKATSLGGGQWHYEYAVYNVNADRSGGSFSVSIPPGAQITNVDFHAPFYHSGEIYDNTAWIPTVSSTSVSWAPAAFSPPANENAIRWGTMYTFRFDANVAPGTGAVALGLFKTGSPASISAVGLPVPGVACYANCDSSTTVPVLNVADFTCFLQRFAAADPYANCDSSTTPPVLNVADFTCFLQKFASGCP